MPSGSFTKSTPFTFRKSRWLRRLLAVAAVLGVLDAAWLALHWPDWSKIARGPVPKSRFMQDWEAASGRKAHWRPVTFAALPDHLTRAVVVAEDARFWGHDGIDVDALREAMSENAARGKLAFGGSTISQQTAKNLFLTPSRTPLRKWHELVYTWGLERNVSKRRILEIYLNDAELGVGIFGVEAAAHEYFGVGVAQLSIDQAIELAASLPSPKKHNPKTRTKRFLHRVKKIGRHLDRWGGVPVTSAPMHPLVTPAPDVSRVPPSATPEVTAEPALVGDSAAEPVGP